MTTPVTIRELVRCMWYTNYAATRSVPRPSECTKIVGGWPPAPLGELTALPQAPIWIQGVVLLRGGEGKGRRGQGGEGLPHLEITSGYALDLTSKLKTFGYIT